MSDLKLEKIFSTEHAENFIGRTRELDALLRHAKGQSRAEGLLLLSAPLHGASELLKQTFDHLFFEQGEMIPIYFAPKKSDKTAAQCGVRFLQELIKQTVAFRRQNTNILNFGGDVYELAQLAIPRDGHWIDRLLETCRIESRLNDANAATRTALSAPLRAYASNAKVFVMIDNLHEAENFTDEIDFVEMIEDIFGHARFPYVLAGRRRFLFVKMRKNFESLSLEPLSFADSGLLAENFAENFDVRINEQTRDLIAVQFSGNPFFIKSIIQSAAEKKVELDSFGQVEKVYADEVFGGQIGKFYDAAFAEISPSPETQKNISGLLFDALTLENDKTPIESWQKRVGQTSEEFFRTMNLLNAHEIIRLTSNHVEVKSENEVLSDYLIARFRLETITENRALTVGETLSSFLKRAPRLMAKFYRRNSAIGLRELMKTFSCQKVPTALLDYSRFKDEYKGAPSEDLLKTLQKDEEITVLPQIVYTAHTISFYPQFAQVIERERSAVALGFLENKYTDEDEIVWIAVEIDSKLEATKELAEFWCDRLEIVALMCNFLNYRLWLVAPEGFSPEACEVLSSRNAFGSSKKQVELLAQTLGVRGILDKKIKGNEYEMIVPMGEDTELIAAQTVEEIAKRYHFAPKAINQIKTALVEACINATEHSLSPDRKIYQKFSIEDNKLIITISNRGLRLADKKAQEIAPDEGRRGWGLKLMKSLMDEVKFEQTDDGTRISMTKYLTAAT
jgi:serine/threonine-protein kinase RsbW